MYLFIMYIYIICVCLCLYIHICIYNTYICIYTDRYIYVDICIHEIIQVTIKKSDFDVTK